MSKQSLIYGPAPWMGVEAVVFDADVAKRWAAAFQVTTLGEFVDVFEGRSFDAYLQEWREDYGDEGEPEPSSQDPFSFSDYIGENEFVTAPHEAACLNYWDEVHDALRRDTDLQQRVEVGGGSPMGGDQITGALADLELLATLFAQDGIVMVRDDNVIEEAFPRHLYI